MGIWKGLGLGFLGLVGLGMVIGQSIRATQPAPPPKTEAQEALEQCNVIMWNRYGWRHVDGPGRDFWPSKSTGGFVGMYSVQGPNAFGMPVMNTIECEVARDAKGNWQIPLLWNVTANGDRLDPRTLERRRPRAKRTKPRLHTETEPPVHYDESGNETVTTTGDAK